MGSAAPVSVSNEPMAEACDGCRFGTEHEKLGYNLADNTRLGYEKIRGLLEGLCERFGWEPVMEGEYIIGAELDGQNVSLEPGGQFELSGAPLDTLHKTCAEVANHLYQVVGELPDLHCCHPGPFHVCQCAACPFWQL